MSSSYITAKASMILPMAWKQYFPKRTVTECVVIGEDGRRFACKVNNADHRPAVITGIQHYWSRYKFKVNDLALFELVDGTTLRIVKVAVENDGGGGGSGGDVSFKSCNDDEGMHVSEDDDDDDDVDIMRDGTDTADEGAGGPSGAPSSLKRKQQHFSNPGSHRTREKLIPLAVGTKILMVRDVHNKVMLPQKNTIFLSIIF